MAQELQKTFKITRVLREQIVTIIDSLREQQHPLSNYGGGNLLNLCLNLKLDLNGLDFSNLSIWHAYLPQVELHNVNFVNADLTKSLFAETFGGVLCVAFSPEGKLLASGDNQGNIYLREVSTGQVFRMYQGHTSWIRAIAFSPDGKTIATSSHDFTVKLWNLLTGQCIHTLLHNDMAGRLKWSPDGTKLATVSFDGKLRVWDIDTGKCLQTCSCKTPQIGSVDWSSDGKFLVCPGGDSTILLWDAATGTLLKNPRKWYSYSLVCYF